MSYKKLFMLMYTASGLAMAFPAFAQTDAPADDGFSADDAIIVTARRRDEDVQEVPIVINTVTSEAVNKLNLRGFEDVKGLVPGLDLSNNVNGIGGNASIRGINFDVNVSGNNPSVEFYLNDTPITAGMIMQQMYDIGQIEVLRGPQGTLRGRASPSGSITITTRKADLHEVGGYVSLTANHRGTMNGNAAIGVPVIPGVLAVRAAGLIDGSNGDNIKTIHNTVDGRDPYNRTKSGRVSAVFQPLDWLNFEGMYQRIDRRIRSYVQVESASIADPASPSSPLFIRARDRLAIAETGNYITQKMDAFNWKAQASFAGQSLIYAGSHRKQNIYNDRNYDLANYFVGDDFYRRTHTRSRDTSHEVRLQNEDKVLGIFDYVVGYFHQKGSSPSDLIEETPIAMPPFPPATQGSLVSIVGTPIGRIGGARENSVFGNLTAHIGDSFVISGGLRYIDIKSTSQLLVGGNLVTDVPEKTDKVIYSGSVNYFVNPDVMLYASVGSSFRPGPVAIGDFSVNKSELQESFLQLNPETSTNYEIGLKSSLFNRRVRFNISGYYQKFKNYPYRSNGVYYVNYAATPDGLGGYNVTPGVSSFEFISGVPVKVYGVEGDISADVTPNLTISAVASYSLGKIRNGLIPCDDLNGDGIPDNLTSAPSLGALQGAYGADNLGACNVKQRSSFQSPFSATIQTEYTRPVSGNMDYFLRGIYSFYGKSQNDPTNAIDNRGAYGLLNVFTGIHDADSAWEVSLFAKNILNSRKVLSRDDTLVNTEFQELQAPGFTSTAGTTYSAPYRMISMVPQREFGINVRFAFGSR